MGCLKWVKILLIQASLGVYFISIYVIFIVYVIPGVSVKFLLVGETNSMVGYHLMAEGHSIQLGVWGGAVNPPSISRAALWWWLEFFGNFFKYK